MIGDESLVFAGSAPTFPDGLCFLNWIADFPDQPLATGQTVGYTVSQPLRIDLANKVPNVIPTGSFPPLRRLPDKNTVKRQMVASSVSNKIYVVSDDIADRSEQLKQECGGIRFSVRLNATYDFARKAVEGRLRNWLGVVITECKR